MKIVVIKEARNQKGVLQVRIARKDTVSVEVAVVSSKFNSKTVGPSRQSSSVLKIM